ncbi:hypothetical protein E4U31_000918 [Claviceps sp. LM219 group G6]|nr:hypothetical protein E4U31_000918 [Claviceps sp. LM219 group G6]
MRTKKWYGRHFTEVAKILNDNLAYARVIIAVGMRTNVSDTDLSEILPEEVEVAIKAAAEISMGTEIMEEDLENIKLFLAALVGYLLGARLIVRAGSLINLAKLPGSTIQMLGAEKQLFRASKTKHVKKFIEGATIELERSRGHILTEAGDHMTRSLGPGTPNPKYGLIFQSSLINQATGHNKGKTVRTLAAKTALVLHVNALGDLGDLDERAKLGLTARIEVEERLRQLKEGKVYY